MKTIYYKLVCETLSFDKEILVDVNCANISQVEKEMEKHKELLTENNTWIIYPMSVTI